MSKPILVKICGLTDEESMEAAIEAGADMVGVVFFANSPRAVSLERAAELLQFVPDGVRRVGLFVDPEDALLDAVMNHVRLDFFQLHGNEPAERVERLRLEYGMPVIKAVGVATADDLALAENYTAVADWLMFDAKAPAAAERPGGNAASFDWSILKERRWPGPWLLAGGLTAANVGEAIRRSGAKAVDVSSGVETAPGVKDPELIRQFIAAAKGKA